MKKAFTLIEILIVVLVIGIIAAVAIPSLNNVSARNNTAKAKADVRALQVAIENYYLYNNSLYPSSLSALTTAVPVIVKSLPNDPFSGTAYAYNRSPNGKYFVVYSAGPSRGGSAYVSDAGTLTEADGANCIYASNIQEDAKP